MYTNINTVLKMNNKVNISGEHDKKIYGITKTVNFDNEIRKIFKTKEGREYFKFNNQTWYLDELEEFGILLQTI